MPTRTATLAQFTSALDAGRSVYAQPFTFTYASIPSSARNITCTLSGKLHPGYYTAMSYSTFFYLQQVAGGTRLLEYSSGIGTRDTTFSITSGISIHAGDSSSTFYYSWQASSAGRAFIQFQDLTLTISWDEAPTTFNVTTAVNPAGSGSLAASPITAAAGTQITLSPSAATGYHFDSYSSSPTVSIANNKFTMPAGNVTVTAKFVKTNYSVTTAVSPTGGGTLTASKTNNAQMGDQITLTPSPAAGYQFSGYTSSPAVSITNNKFTMPAGNVTITATFTKVSYQITKSVSPTGGGSVTTSASSAAMGTTITLGNTPASGYVFDHYTMNGTTVGGSFSMPAGNAAVIAYFNKLTTGTISNTSLTPGTNATVTLTLGDNSFTHDIVMTFGTNTKTWTAAAGVRTVDVSPEASWCNSIPNANNMTGGTLVVKTKKNGAVIGTVTISNALVFNVPTATGFYPTATVGLYVLRTVDGQTYPSVGNIFVQGKCGVEVRFTNPVGAYGSTIVSTEITVQGYTGEDFHKTGTGAITLQSGLLTTAGTLTVISKVTDSRGRGMIYTSTAPVHAYSEPSANLNVHRCDAQGEELADGLYAKYDYSCSYSQVGSNTLTMTLSIDGHEIDLEDLSGSGWVLGDTHYQFPILEAHDLYLTMEDAFVTKTVSVTIPSQRFLIHFSADGTSVAIGQTASTGQKRFTVAQDMTVYIGSRTLEQYIHDVVGI